MLSVLVKKLESFELLPEEAKNRLRCLPVRATVFAPREDMVLEAEPRGDVRVIMEGVAARTKTLDSGRQAILGFLLPGDVDETDTFVETLDHGITAITACKIVQIARAPFDQMVQEDPDLARGLRRLARLEEAVRRIWLANMGQQVADRQAAHLLCELHVRLQAAGMGMSDGFANPFTQEHLANALGISPVHMNRVMQHLRELGLVYVGAGHSVRFPSAAAIRQYANFDETYLKGGIHSRAAPSAKEQIIRLASTMAGM